MSQIAFDEVMKLSRDNSARQRLLMVLFKLDSRFKSYKIYDFQEYWPQSKL